MLNNICVQGRIVHTPELRSTKSDKQVCNISIACNRGRKDESGEYPTDFFDVVLWGKSAEIIADKCGKGDQIIIRGRMESRKYEAKDGSTRTAWEIQADGFEFCGGKRSSAGDENAQDEPVATDAESADSSDVLF